MLSVTVDLVLVGGRCGGADTSLSDLETLWEEVVHLHVITMACGARYITKGRRLDGRDKRTVQDAGRREEQASDEVCWKRKKSLV